MSVRCTTKKENTFHLFHKKISFYNKKIKKKVWNSMLNLGVILISKDLCTKKKFYSIEFVARFSTSEHLFLFSNELVLQ